MGTVTSELAPGCPVAAEAFGIDCQSMDLTSLHGPLLPDSGLADLSCSSSAASALSTLAWPKLWIACAQAESSGGSRGLQAPGCFSVIAGILWFCFLFKIGAVTERKERTMMRCAA